MDFCVIVNPLINNKMLIFIMLDLAGMSLTFSILWFTEISNCFPLALEISYMGPNGLTKTFPHKKKPNQKKCKIYTSRLSEIFLFLFSSSRKYTMKN